MIRQILRSRQTRGAFSPLSPRWRGYATPTSPSIGPRSGKAAAHDNTKSNSDKDKYADSPWRKPLASTQTMSLFSTSPPALLFAVEQSLRGAMGALVKADPQGGHSTDPRDYLLLFAIDKTLPSDVLAETTRLFRDIPIPHVGVLSAPVPGTLLPQSAISDASSEQTASLHIPPPFYHSVSLSLLPATLAQPFYSDIPGVAPIKAGRWASGKPAFDETQSRVGHLDEQGEEKDWRSIWGKENLSGRIPGEMSAVDPASHLLTLILGSDTSPQGLLEGVDSHFPHSPLLGSLASNTVFETGGRDATMFYRGKVDKEATEGKKATNDEDGQARIFSKGAVGLYLRTPSQEKLSQNSTRARPSVDLEMPWKNFLSLGTRRQITRAKGNIVSSLDDSNACQHFLRDVASRDRNATGDDGLPTEEEDMSMEAKARGMSREEQRLLSKGVKKEENFWAAIWGNNGDEKPLLLARILSGHPSRGTISLDTDLELSTGLTSPDVVPPPSSEQPKLSLEFYQEVDAKAGEPDTTVEPLSIPGQDLGAWRLPRFLFINHQKADAVQGDRQASSQDQTSKPAVHALPNLFVLSSESGLISRDPSLFNKNALDILRQGGDTEGKSATDVLQSRTGTWKANGLKAWVDLRGRPL